ncbi:MAG: hypothetical protein VSS75_011025 [Candidatus Parabeggiatoa sp.]|nr:hypothetical protein [Candidatus Parabeggiatoa sp.]
MKILVKPCRVGKRVFVCPPLKTPHRKLTAVLVEAIKALHLRNEKMAQKIEALSTSQP